MLPAVFLTHHLSLQICTVPCFTLKAVHEVCILGFPQHSFQLGLASRRCQWKAGEGEEKRNRLPHFDAALPSGSPSPPQQLPLGLSLGFGSTVSSQGPLAGSGNGTQHSCSLGTSLSLICFLSPDHTPNIAFPLKALSGVKFIFLLNSTDTVALTWVVVVGIDKRKSL